MGMTNALVAGLIPLRFPFLFTTDPYITQQMKDLVPWLCTSLIAHASTMALEGIILAQRDVVYLASCYGINTALMVAGLWLTTNSLGLGIHGVWLGLLMFQVIRFTQFSSRVWMRMKEGAAAAATTAPVLATASA